MLNEEAKPNDTLLTSVHQAHFNLSYAFFSGPSLPHNLLEHVHKLV